MHIYFHTSKLLLPLLAALLIAPGACEAQSERWDRRDKWQDVAAIFEAMALETGHHVADIGARDGYLTVRLADAVGGVGHVFAVDIDADALKKLGKNLNEDTENVTLVHSTTDDPSLPAGSLDAAVIVNAYHEFDAYASMLSHIWKALKPDGRLVLVEPIAERRRSASRKQQAASHEIGIDFARADLREAGFEIVEARDPFVDRKHRNDTMWLLVGRRPDHSARR